MKRIGIIGAGQLGQMLGQAAKALDLECEFLDPSPDPPAATVGLVHQHAFDDVAALRRLAAATDVVTYEFENVPVGAIESIAAVSCVYPRPNALRHAQDRLSEKRLFESLDIPVAPYRAVDSAQDLRKAAGEIGLPIVLKTRRLGYDGKGQTIVRDSDDIAAAVATLGGDDLIAEQLVSFEREVSAIGVRNVRGDVAVYPLIENQHRDGILDCSRAPLTMPGLAKIAGGHLGRMLSHLDYVGVLTIEFFDLGGELLANEYAPRVHNSGHWTIEGARTSQFENHLRAILDLPLGDVSPAGHAAMLNLIGRMPPDGIPLNPQTAWLHDYGKAPRAGRKLGHITIVTDNPDERELDMIRIRKMLIP